MANTTGKKHGGRVKGTPNKATQSLLEIAEKHDCNPFEVLILFAKGDFETLGLPERTFKQFGENVSEELTISPELRQKSAKDACEYLFPKRKSVEVRTDFSQKSDAELLSHATTLLGELSGKRKP